MFGWGFRQYPKPNGKLRANQWRKQMIPSADEINLVPSKTGSKCSQVIVVKKEKEYGDE